jgi:hypothetical protein
MDPLQNDIWAHLGQVTDVVPDSVSPAPPVAPDVAAAGVRQDVPVAPDARPAEPGEQRASDPTRRRFDRGGRRRSDWPEDAGMTCCPGCGFESIQSLGMLDSGDYLWQCPHCDRRFNTGRATRTML